MGGAGTAVPLLIPAHPSGASCHVYGGPFGPKLGTFPTRENFDDETGGKKVVKQPFNQSEAF